MKYDNAYDNILDAYIWWVREGADRHTFFADNQSPEDEEVLLDILDELGVQLTPIDELLGAIEGLAQSIFNHNEARH
jgi:hypothetical protein